MARSTIISVHIQPRAGMSEVVGWHGDAVKIRLRSAPVDGAANDELVRLMSKLLGVPRGAVSIVAGATSRRKRLSLDGVSRSHVLAALGLEPE
jgi:uncharacterized protein (TIGR00251 family)